MASLTHTLLFHPLTIIPAGRGRQKKEESQIKCSLSLSFRLNPWRFSQALTLLQVCNVQLGSEEVADGPLASHSKGKTHHCFSCVASTPPFHHPVQVTQFKGDPIICPYQFCLYHSNVFDRQIFLQWHFVQKYATAVKNESVHSGEMNMHTLLHVNAQH